MTTARLNYPKAAPAAYEALLAWTQGLKDGLIPASLRHLIFTRVSQINGCAYCIDMHTKEAMADGETPQRLFALGAWAETSFFTDKERTALAYAEAVTLISESHISDEMFAELATHFSEQEIVELTHLIAAMNAWNRLGIAFRAQPRLQAKAA